ncbi:MAG: folylpolyglutamate synthase/dihydrofolate synthase family protein [Bacteroidales bacterium]|jgi:dihydrofolate synthase/folylpolyglutamate synthase|nr:folylpolyglutamate synthase/dihydrofolate synthase family protein [Bacteroidales bacterium]
MNYQETIDYLLSYLPMFQRIGAAAYKADIYNTVELMKALGNPEKKFKSIHVAGTNGKGSSSHLIASILREKGLKVGLHTSPHLKDFRERIKIDNKMCDEEFVINFVENNKELIKRIKPSFFETAVAMAFTYFAQENVDIAIIEVGMGGRLDSTNVINPLACLITNISFDHTQFLGNSLEAIAQEKAGIIKQNTPVVISQTQKETQNVFSSKANEKNSPICFADSYLSCENVNHSQGLLKMDIYKNGVERIKNLQSSLSGYYQQKNILGVVALIDMLNQYHNFNISDEEIKQGIENLSSNFPIAGRWQTLCNKPLTICDTGHNEDGLKYVIEQIKNTPHEKLRFVLAMVNDKDVNKVLSMLDKDAEYYLSQAKIPRALPVDELAEKAQQAGLSFTKYATISQALAQAQQDSEENDLVFVGGSTFTVAEVV